MSGYPGASVQDALAQLCKSVTEAGKKPVDVLLLAQKLFTNIKDNPKEEKFRQLKPSNSKLHEGLFQYAGAKELFKAAGFKDQSGSLELPLELPGKSAIKFNDAFRAVIKRYEIENEAGTRATMQEEKKAKDALNTALYQKALGESVKGEGRGEIQALSCKPEGWEALRLLAKILVNLRCWPNNEAYKSVNMAGKTGQKLLPATSLLKLAGFKLAGEKAEISNVDIHVMERLIAMINYALNLNSLDPAPAAVSLPAGDGTLGLALGAALGVAVGDALGAPLELLKRCPLSAGEVDAALEMCGGGCHSVAPGQVTDDTELTICLADALAACSGKQFPADEVANRYCGWWASQPFDIGNATKIAFGSRNGLATECERRASANIESQANGALMRAVPLALWAFGRGLSVEELAEAAGADARLSHPNHTLVAANAAYVICIVSLLRTAGDRSAALKVVTEWSAAQKLKNSPGWERLDEWLQEALCDNVDVLPFTGPDGGDVGWAKIGFMHAFRSLRAGNSYEEAMRLTLTGGGDTDTNAAIVGGLIGAAVGIRGIPEHFLRAVLSCDTGKGMPRDPMYHPKRLPGLIEQLVTPPGTS